ncbi:Tudor domain-containing protein 5 [Harpegnathos saltator]|uniref:Tudor domain-containing protein 5 n=1 Tax=Harpegnathos saltator TaxID=610380 RepID=E2BSE1_HARSA|nr:Tudor domain-containing protein 5 [Harpegnathos saltator]
MSNETALEDVRKVILSLLVARPDFTPISVLDNDYCEVEGRHIPWHKFDFGSTADFLRSMPQYFEVKQIGGATYVRGIASDKSKHVSSLVSRQKRSFPRCTPRLRSTHNSRVLRQRPKIPAEQLNILVQYVQNFPKGVNINSALLMIQKQLPYVNFVPQDIKDQLRELRHKLYIDGDIIRPVETNGSASKTNISSSDQSSLPTSELMYNAPTSSSSNVVFTVPEEYHDDLNIDDDDFVRSNSVQHHLRRQKTDERLASSLKEFSDYEQMLNYYDTYKDREKYNNNTEYFKNSEITETNNLSNLINDRIRSRLVQLMQKYPDGIQCSELPELYMKEYKTPLNYAELGFNSISTYVSYLPEIFYMTRENVNGDFILYSVDIKLKHQSVVENSNQGKSYSQETISKTKPITISKSQSELCETDDDDAPFPSNLSPGILDKFAPKDVTTYKDVCHILVTDLQKSKKQYLEVYVVEVFTPSFFWIQLRKNKRQFEKFMENLHTYYQQHCESYRIPKLALHRGLNCACIYAGMWHRGVIKTVKPDYRVTIMFYDYGTQKTYAPENVYYLKENFSKLEAQAIPCGLYNVKPYVGDRWKKSITDRFTERISESLLAASIVSVDPSNNSMLVVLTDTSEEEDVHINDWLVRENLARCGKMVRTNKNFAFVEYYICHIANTSNSVKKESVVVRTNKAKRNEKQHKLNNIMSETFVKNVRALCKVPDRNVDINVNRQKNMAGLTDSSLDILSRSRDDSTDKNRPRRSNRLAALVEVVKAKRGKPKMNEEMSQTNPDAKVEELQSNNVFDKYLNHEQLKKVLNRDFDERNSDNETNINEKDFGTFHSMYGGYGDMIPFDWSLVRQTDSPATSSSCNLKNSSKTNTCLNKMKKIELLPVNRHDHKAHDRMKKITKSYLLDIAHMEKEYFLADCNIDRDNEDVSQSVARLGRKLKTQDDNCTEIAMSRKIYDKLRMHTCAKKSSSCDEVSSSMDEISIDELCTDRKCKTPEIHNDQKIENTNPNLETKELTQESNLSSRDLLDSNIKKYQHNRNKTFHVRYQNLPDRVKDTKLYWNSSSESNVKGWSSSDPYPLSCYSSTDETMISSDDDQRETFSRKNVMSRFNKLQSFATKSASKEFMSTNSKSNLEAKDNPDSCNDEPFSNVIYLKLKRRMNLLDDSRASDVLRHVLKVQQKWDADELDSDDLSDHENNIKNNVPIELSPKSLLEPSLEQPAESPLESLSEPPSELELLSESSSEPLLETPLYQTIVDNTVVTNDLTDNADDTKMSIATIMPRFFDDENIESDGSIWDVCSGL